MLVKPAVMHRLEASESEGPTTDVAESADEDDELAAAHASDEEAQTDVERRQSNRHASTRETGEYFCCIGNFQLPFDRLILQMSPAWGQTLPQLC